MYECLYCFVIKNTNTVYSTMFFQNLNGEPCRDILGEFQDFMKEYGLPGSHTFSFIRSSFSSSFSTSIGRFFQTEEKVRAWQQLKNTMRLIWCSGKCRATARALAPRDSDDDVLTLHCGDSEALLSESDAKLEQREATDSMQNTL